jgi:prepilin-type N-terminal cleavage/methylation domain-containing protein
VAKKGETKMKKMKKGFTIVELVIVIAVIGILSAILIPTFSGVTEDAKKKAAFANARNEIIDRFNSADEIEDAIYLDANGYYVLIVDGNVSGDAKKEVTAIFSDAEGAGLNVADYKITDAQGNTTYTFTEGVNILPKP